MVSGVPIIFDEFSPNIPRGHNPAHTHDELKIMFDPAVGNTISGKGQNGNSTGAITFAPRMPRLITSNASNPHEFLKCLPADLLSPSYVFHYSHMSEHARALLKRLCFAKVSSSLLSGEAISEHNRKKDAVVSARFDEIFSGSNAIP